ncbi:glycosyltransferase family 4 protein [Enterococcus faecalis]|nr:glycosyltransferase family 4 protein [Enterococcus faecalis]
MMRALFVYDGPIQFNEEGHYFSQVINNTVFNRYLNHADHLTVAIRTDPCGPDFDLQKTQMIDTEKVSIVALPSLSDAKGFLFNRKVVKNKLKSELKLVDFAIIRLPSFIGTEAVKAAICLDIPYLIEVVGCPWDSLWNYGLKGKTIAPYLTFSMKKQVKNAPFVIYVTNSFLQDRYPTKGKNTNCSNVEINDVSQSILESRLRRIRRINSNNDKLIIGTTAAVNVPYKGHQYIIESLAKLKKEGINNFEYQMVGFGDQSRLSAIIKENGVEDRVKFMGTMSHNQVFEWLDTIDIYAQPSRQEGLPRALIEAMSRGLPAIGARTGGIPELIVPERIFSNSNKNIDEICDLLKGFSKEKLEKDAKRNFYESKKYVTSKITERRNALLDDLTKEVQE